MKILTSYNTIPDCCREGWDSCPHVIGNKKVRVKRNIAL